MDQHATGTPRTWSTSHRKPTGTRSLLAASRQTCHGTVKRARLAAVVHYLLWQHEWVRDKWFAFRRHCPGIPDTQREGAHNKDTLAGLLRFIGVTYESHPLLKLYHENYKDPSSSGPQVPAQLQRGEPQPKSFLDVPGRGHVQAVGVEGP